MHGSDSSSSDDIVQLPHGMYENMEEQLAEAQRIAHLGSWEWDIVSNAVTWSDETYRIYGLAPRSVAVNYELYQSLIHPDDRELGRKVIRSSLESGEPFDYEHRIIRPDGSVRLLNARGRVIRGPDGTAIRMFGTGQDITERREAEVALRSAAEEAVRRAEAEGATAHLNRVFAQAPVVIAVVRGPDHVFETVNPKFLELAGDSDVLGKPAREALADLVDEQLFDLLDTVYSTGRPFVGTGLPARRTDSDSQPYFNFVYQPLTEESGVYGILIVATEVTEQVKARELAERARQSEEAAKLEALAASKAKSDFLATMSHELRTPLAAIIGYGDLLSGEITGPINEQQRRQLARIKTSADHLLSIIDEILTIARSEAGKERMVPEAVAINELLESVGPMAEQLASNKGLRFNLWNLDEPLVIATDSIKLRQILLNLLSNAVNYTDQGQISVIARTDGERLHIAVADTGVGVGPENLEKIFEPFWQVEQTTTRRVGGTGLGLAVTREFVKLLNGELTVSSEVGIGSTFTLSLPI